MIALKIKKNVLKTDKDTLLVTTYIHPVHSTYYKIMGQENTIDMIGDFLGDFLEKNEFDHVIMLGDTNCRISDWKPSIKIDNGNNEYDKKNKVIFERVSTDDVINHFGKRLIELCACFDSVPMLGLTW